MGHKMSRNVAGAIHAFVEILLKANFTERTQGTTTHAQFLHMQEGFALTKVNKRAKWS